MKCRRSKGRSKHGRVGFQPNSATRGLGSYIYIFKVTLPNMGTHDKKDRLHVHPVRQHIGSYSKFLGKKSYIFAVGKSRETYK